MYKKTKTKKRKKKKENKKNRSDQKLVICFFGEGIFVPCLFSVFFFSSCFLSPALFQFFSKLKQLKPRDSLARKLCLSVYFTTFFLQYLSGYFTKQLSTTLQISVEFQRVLNSTNINQPFLFSSFLLFSTTRSRTLKEATQGLRCRTS